MDTMCADKILLVAILGLSFDTQSIPVSSNEQMKDSELLSLLGLKLALENRGGQHNTTKHVVHGINQSQSSIDPEETVVKAVTHIQLQTFGDSYILSCKTHATNTTHSIYLSCPLMPIGCFENCKRTCEPTGCVQEASLRNVMCHAVHYSEKQGIVRQFEYKMNKYDKNITGKWSCFHAGVRSQIIHVQALPRPTTTTTTTTTTTVASTSTVTTTTTRAPIPSTTVTNLGSSDFSSSSEQASKLPTKTAHHFSTIDLRTFQTGQAIPTRYWPNGIVNRYSKLHAMSSTTRRSVNRSSSILRNERYKTRQSTLLGFLSSKMHLLLAILILLALSLLTNLVFCLQFVRIYQHGKAKTLLHDRSLKSIAKNSMKTARVPFNRSQRTETEVYANKQHRQQTWLSSNGVDLRPPSCSSLPGGVIKNSRSCQFNQNVLENSSQMFYRTPSITRLPTVQPDLAWNWYGLHVDSTDSELQAPQQASVRLGRGLLVPLYPGHCSMPATGSHIFPEDHQPPHGSSHTMHRSITLPVSTVPYEALTPTGSASNFSPETPSHASSATHQPITTQLLSGYKNDRRFYKRLQLHPRVSKKPRKDSTGSSRTDLHLPIGEHSDGRSHRTSSMVVELPSSSYQDRRDLPLNEQFCPYIMPSCTVKEKALNSTNGCCIMSHDTEDGTRLEMSRSLMYKADVLLKEADSLLK